jgi:glycosyl transferase, family 25
MSSDMLAEPATNLQVRPSKPPPPPPPAAVEIVVISLPSATKRRQWISQMFEGTSLTWSFFDAHTSLRQSGLHYDSAATLACFGRGLSVPELAIWSSHVAVLSEFLQRSQANHILVLEDDVIFDTDFPLARFCAFCAENGIEYIRLFGKHYAKGIRLGFFYDRSIMRYETTPAGAQAYLMSKKGAKAFLDAYRTVDTTVDLAMDSFWKVPLPIYSIFPYPIIERFSPTSIPMAPYGHVFTLPERLSFSYRRIVTKLRKMRANAALRKADQRLRERNGHFRQIFGSDTEN